VDVKQRIQNVLDGKLDAQGPVTLPGGLLGDALAEIERLEASHCKDQKRFDFFFAAALQGILARSTAGDLMSGKSELVNEARRVAQLCMREGTGEIR
jgi:hypothetical protein